MASKIGPTFCELIELLIGKEKSANVDIASYICRPDTSIETMKTIQFREAVCEAMSEEMRRDENIYLMGEEVAEYNGAYKASKGMLDEFGPKRVIDTPIAELGSLESQPVLL